MNYIARRLLDTERLYKIRSLIDKCEWIDGNKTWNGEKGRKKNQEVKHQDPYLISINELVMKSLDNDPEFLNYTLATTTSRIIVSKYNEGCYYNYHYDKYTMGNYSTTVFLNDPETYEGGELCLCINGKEELFKLPAGHAITYETGILHRVNEVTKGERSAIVFWSDSKASDKFLVDLYRDVTRLESKLVEKYGAVNDFSDYNTLIEDPVFLIGHISEKLMRALLR
jgi:PKHD-type hydroxylase